MQFKKVISALLVLQVLLVSIGKAGRIERQLDIPAYQAYLNPHQKGSLTGKRTPSPPLNGLGFKQDPNPTTVIRSKPTGSLPERVSGPGRTIDTKGSLVNDQITTPIKPGEVQGKSANYGHHMKTKHSYPSQSNYKSLRRNPYGIVPLYNFKRNPLPAHGPHFQIDPYSTHDISLSNLGGPRPPLGETAIEFLGSRPAPGSGPIGEISHSPERLPILQLDPVQPGVPFLKRPPTNGPGGVGVGYPGADFISDVNQYALGLGGPGPGPNFPRPGGPSRPPVPPGVPLETGDINNKLTGQIAPTSDLEGPALHLLNGPVNFRVPDLKLPVHGNFYDGFKDDVGLVSSFSYFRHPIHTKDLDDYFRTFAGRTIAKQFHMHMFDHSGFPGEVLFRSLDTPESAGSPLQSVSVNKDEKQQDKEMQPSSKSEWRTRRKMLTKRSSTVPS